MAPSWVLVIAIFAGLQNTVHSSSRIVGGNEARIEDYPSLVQVEFQNIFSQIWSQSCAGSILTSRFVLSAAHCFSGTNFDMSLRRIRAGSSLRNVGGVIAYLQGVYNHPTYGDLGSDGDISVIRLASSLVYTPVVQQASIVSQGVQIPSFLFVKYAGWGLTSAGGSPSSVLLDASVFTIDNVICKSNYGSLPEKVPITENMICAGLPDIDACGGDAGGPLYYQDVLIGVISSGIGCGNYTYPAISTSVSSYSDWIVATIS